MTGKTMAVINGHKWFWWQARHCDEYGGEPVLLMKRWFLRDAIDWVGDFGTKREMLKWIDDEGAAWVEEFGEATR